MLPERVKRLSFRAILSGTVSFEVEVQVERKHHRHELYGIYDQEMSEKQELIQLTRQNT